MTTRNASRQWETGEQGCGEGSPAHTEPERLEDRQNDMQVRNDETMRADVVRVLSALGQCRGQLILPDHSAKPANSPGANSDRVLGTHHGRASNRDRTRPEVSSMFFP